MVRVVSVGRFLIDLLKDPGNPKWKQFSVEFCGGGTHLGNAGDAEKFVVIAEESVSKGNPPPRRPDRKIRARCHDAEHRHRGGLIAQGKLTTPANIPNIIASLQKAIAGGGGGG